MTNEAYCKAVFDGNELDNVFCESNSCDSDFACCFHICEKNYIDSNGNFKLQPFCTVNFLWVEGTNTFCTDYCNNPININEHECGVNQDRSCTETECFYLRCELNNPDDVCSEDFSQVLNKTNHCTELL